MFLTFKKSLASFDKKLQEFLQSNLEQQFATYFKWLLFLVAIVLMGKGLLTAAKIVEYWDLRGFAYTDIRTHIIALLAFPLGTLMLLLLYFEPQFLRQKLQMGSRLAETLFKKLQPKVVKYLQAKKRQIIAWWRSFKPATPKQKLWLLRKPLALIFALALIINFGPLFFPPKVVVIFPGDNGENIPLSTGIEVQFDRPMHHNSAEKNFHLRPLRPGGIGPGSQGSRDDVKGVFSWEGSTRLIFKPDPELERSLQYIIRIDGGTLSSRFIPKIYQDERIFATIGHPQVLLASPQTEGSTGKTPITIMFDRPMIPLTSVDHQEPLPAFTLNPELPGEDRWLGTSAYEFRPAKDFLPATTYTYLVPHGLKSQDGGELQEDAVFSFSTLRPRVINTTPQSNYNFANPTASVSAAFNLPIDKKSASQKIHLFKMNDDKKTEVATTLKFVGPYIGMYPGKPLERGATYEASIASGLTSSLGPNGTESDYSWNFTVTPLPKVTGTTPQNEAKDIDEMHRIAVSFVSPMDEDSFAGNVIITPAPERKPTTYSNGSELNIGTYLARSTKYQITITGNVKDQYGTPLGRDYSFGFDTDSFPQSISIQPSNTYFAQFNQAVVPRIVAKVVNATTVDYKLYKLPQEEFMSLYRSYMDYRRELWQSYNPEKLELVRSWSEKFAADKDVPVNVITKVQNEDGSLIAPGLYFLDALSGENVHDNLVMVISKSALTLKLTEKQALVWAVDQASGAVVKDMEVNVTSLSGNSLAKGTTNADGVALLTGQFKSPKDYNRNPIFAFATGGNDQAVVIDSWDQGIDSYEFGLSHYYDPHGSEDNSKLKLYVVVDRPIYRPGHTIYYKGAARLDADGIYRLPEGIKEASIVIKDAQGKTVHTNTLQINSYGTFSGSYSLPDSASVGDYSLSTSVDGSDFTQSFQVEEYSVPEFSVKTNTNKTEYVDGQPISITVNSDYYFGTPLKQAPLQWTVVAYDQSYRWAKDSRFEFGDSDEYWHRPWWTFGSENYYSGKKTAQGKGATNQKGEYTITVPTNLAGKTTNQAYSIEAVVEDENSNQAISGTKEVTVYQSSVLVGIKPVHYAANAGKEASIELVTINPQGEEVPNIPVSLNIYKRSWESIKEKNSEDGEFYFVSKPIDKLVDTQTAATNNIGRSTLSFTPQEGGNYHLVAQTTDAAGHQSKSSSSLWVSGAGFQVRPENHDRIVLVPDKQEYQIGDTAQIYAAVPYPQMTGLVTIERADVLDYQIQAITPQNQTLSMPIKDRYSPNAYVSGTFIKAGSKVKDPAQFKMGLAEIRVTNPKNKISVDLKPEKDRYTPGETLKLNISTKDGLDQPTQTELAVALVDEAVWSLARSELVGIYETFYRPRNLQVATSNNLTVSMDRINANVNLGSKGGSGGGGGDGGPLTFREKFLDTAYWQAHLETDANGNATIDIPLPDNLTTWKIIGIALSKDTQVGHHESQVLVTKDVLIEALLPRFLSTGDKPEVGMTVHNTTAATQKVLASIQAQGLNIPNQKDQQITIPTGESAVVTWPTEVTATDSASISLIAKGSEKFSDAMKVTLPIVSYFTPQTTATSGQAADSATETVKLPNDIVPNQGKLTITLSPTLGNGVQNAASYLLSYLYWCSEQSVSRITALVPLIRYAEEANLDTIAGYKTTDLESTINNSLARLVKSQHPSGGWAWWTNGDPSPSLTSIVMDGLLLAKREKFTVPQETLDKGANYLKTQILNSGLDLNTQAFVASVISQVQPVGASTLNYLMDRRWEMTPLGRAYLLRTFQSTSGISRDRGRIFDELLSLAKKTNTTASWEDKDDWQLMSNSVVLTSTMLEALTKENPRHPYIPLTIRWLMQARTQSHWSSTRDTASAIKAITNVMRQRQEGVVKYNWLLDIAGIKKREGTFEKKQLFNQLEESLDLGGLPKNEDIPITISKSGKGSLYYNLNLEYFVPFSKVDPVERGFVVERDLLDRQGNRITNHKVKAGDDLWERITLVVPAIRHHVIIETPLPAGLEPVNESLKTTSLLNVDKIEPSKDKQLLYFRHQEMRDDRVVLFAETVPPGVYEYTYRVRPTTPGVYHHPPARAYNMYLPDIFGHSSGDWFEVVE